MAVTTATLTADPVLRDKLLTYFIDNYNSQELADWLRDIEQDTRGSLAEKKARVREHTKYLTMPGQDFPTQTMKYLADFPSGHLGDICEALGLSQEGSKDERLRRIMREVHYREGWLSRPGQDQLWTVGLVQPFIESYPIIKRGEYEKDFYDAFENEMEEVFGSENVHAELAIAYGNSLKIDFHLGHPQREGVGVEWKLPTSNAEVQRAIGQMDQYRERYADRLLLVLVPDFLEKAQVQMFTDQARSKNITVVVK